MPKPTSGQETLADLELLRERGMPTIWPQSEAFKKVIENLALRCPIADLAADTRRFLRRVVGLRDRFTPNIVAAAGFVELDIALDGSRAVFGPRWQGHGLLHRPLPIPSHLELIATKNIRHFADMDEHGVAGSRRAWSFVRALFAGTRARTEGSRFMAEADESLGIRVRDEVTTVDVGFGPRIDLMIDWTTRGAARRGVIVEAKIYATDTDTAILDQYERFARKELKVAGPVDTEIVCFYLSTRGRSPNSNWAGISWLQLLREWEAQLHLDGEDPGETDFNRFRSNLWTFA